MEPNSCNTACGSCQHIIKLENCLEELNVRNKMLSAFIDNSEAGMYVTDFNTGEILFANRKMTALGSEKNGVEDMIGKACWQMIDQNAAERCSFCPYRHLVNEDGAAIAPYTWEHYFEQYGIWLKIISQVIVWIDGRQAQMNTFYDITDIKTLELELEHQARENEYHRMQKNMQHILENMPVPLRITDQESSTVLYANNAYLQLFNHPALESIVGQKLSDITFLTNNNSSEYLQKTDDLLTVCDLDTFEAEYVTSSGVVVDSRVTVCPIDYQGKKAIIAIITDLSAEHEQQRMLEIAAEKAKEANYLKSNFLSNMSHEIRTPMNAIIGLSEIELNKSHSEETTEIYRKINESAKNLLEIVNDILDLSKIEANKMELFEEEFVLEDVLNNALLVVTPRLEGKHVELMPDISFELPRYFIGDKTRLWQVLKNYLDNAAKYTKNGHIALTVREEKESSKDNIAVITFTIEDTGIGMTPKQLERAYQPYDQIVNEAQKKYAGTGLGLPLSRSICELMGGKTTIESSAGKGTTVRFAVPLKRSERIEEEQQLSMSLLAGLKLLAVDDSMLNIKIMESIFKNSGAEIICTYSGEDAVEIVKSVTDFDVVLLDYLMKGKNGLETAKIIRKYLPQTAKILIVTAYANQFDSNELEQNGIDGIVGKPYSPTVMIEKILAVTGREAVANDGAGKEYVRFKNTRALVCEDNEIN